MSSQYSQQICSNTVGGFNCGCNSGYTLASDGRACIGDSECNHRPCKHHREDISVSKHELYICVPFDLQIPTNAHHLSPTTVSKHALTQKVAIPVIVGMDSHLTLTECLVRVSLVLLTRSHGKIHVILMYCVLS